MVQGILWIRGELQLKAKVRVTHITYKRGHQGGSQKTQKPWNVLVEARYLYYMNTICPVSQPAASQQLTGV